ncbi:V3 [Euphorbia caput-medusae latent virus]|uniref:V3 n=1 Tax=Euphorbia caput-medusae latent virus TaxID=1853865 RepID=A0A166V329_9GEMI|nr:V3 [Euphorbia caput-medusae latent virus]ANA76293.1 V3 [Euphorbia caput-medusae latent virus]
MEKRFYFSEELPDTYGKLQGFCTEYFLGLMIEKAQELGLFQEAYRYRTLRQAFRQSQRRKDKWAIKVAQFNGDLTAAINSGRLFGLEAQKYLDYKSQVENGDYKIGTQLPGPGPNMGPKEEKVHPSPEYNSWAD